MPRGSAKRRGLRPALRAGRAEPWSAVLRRAGRLYREREIREALAHYGRALRLGAEPGCAALERWTCHMLLGEFEKAWRDADWVQARHPELAASDVNLPRHLQRLWTGEPLEGKRVLVRCYHGLGDTIQFIRCVPMLRGIVRSAVVQCQPALIPLLKSMPGIPRLISLDAPALPRHDVQIELMELPRALRLALPAIPDRVPYLSVPAGLARAAGRELRASEPGRCLRVGIAWSSGDWDASRSTCLADWGPVLRVRGAAFVSLQRGPAAAELAGVGARVIAAEKESGALLDTAAIIANLDLVISVDTMVGHLAGALGKPVWTLLPFRADWRWMIRRDDNPWYPTMRLFRQSRQGAWGAVLRRAAAGLMRMAWSRQNGKKERAQRAVRLPACAERVA